MQLLALALAWTPPCPRREFAMVPDYAPPRAPDFQFHDVDGAKISCYWNDSARAGPRMPAHLEFVGSAEERRQLLDAVITDIQIETSTPAYSLRMTPNAVQINQSMSGGAQTFL